MIKFKESQKKFAHAFLSNKYTEILYAGTAGTGKSFATAVLLSMVCHDFQNTRLGVFRKNLTTARKTIWHTYSKALASLGIQNTQIGGSEPKIILTDSDSKIEFFEMDITKDPDWNKLKGLELSLAHVEEANEIDVSGKNILITRIGRWNENKAPAVITMTCNPSAGWVREQFKNPSESGELPGHRAFIESTKEELPADYARLLETLPPAERQRYVENNWDYHNDPHQLIPYELLKTNEYKGNIEKPTRLGVDTAHGGDRTVVCFATENSIMGFQEIDSTNEIVVGRIVQELIKTYSVDPKQVRIDSVGVGNGVVDYLKLQGLKVVGYNGGAAANVDADYLHFKNRRAQDYWNVRDLLVKGRLQVVGHPAIIKELTTVRYFTKDKYIQIESKDEIKKAGRLGRSPDYADSAVMALSDYGKSNFSFVF